MARLGLGQHWNCTFANEWCPKKVKAYRACFGCSGELKEGDVANLTTQDLTGAPDLVWASFPCQDLSLAGMGAGLKGARSGTFTPFWNLMQTVSQSHKQQPVFLHPLKRNALSVSLRIRIGILLKPFPEKLGHMGTVCVTQVDPSQIVIMSEEQMPHSHVMN